MQKSSKGFGRMGPKDFIQLNEDATCACHTYANLTVQAVENNRFSKSLISRKTMQFLEN